MSQISRRHHTVPRFYLNGFARDHRIGTVRLPGHQRFVQSTLNASAQTNFYTVTDAVAGPDVVEKTLASLEGDTARVFESLKSDEWPLAPRSRETLATFLAVQFLRGPNRRRQIEQMMRLLLQVRIGIGHRDGFEEWAMQELGLALTVVEADTLWREGNQVGGPPLTLSTSVFTGHLATSLPAVYPYFAGRPWVLARFNRRSLLTSDTPIALAPDGEAQPFSGVGVGSAMAMTVPLTRNIGLVLSSHANDLAGVHIDEVMGGELDWLLTPTTRYASMFNQATIQNAREWIFHHPDDSDFVPDKLGDPLQSEVASTVPEFLTERAGLSAGSEDENSNPHNHLRDPNNDASGGPAR